MLRQTFGSIALALAGALIAVAGTAAHRYSPYVGVVLCIVLVLGGAIFARAWHRYLGVTAFAIGWSAVALALVYIPGPGQSFAFIEDAVGLTWLLGSSAAVVAAAILPTTVLEGRSDV